MSRLVLQREGSVEKLLRTLGNSADEIAAALEKVGCSGHRQIQECCPLANYLKRMGAGSYVAVGVAQAVGDFGVVDLTGAQTAFVTGFDSGKYPQLIAEVARGK